MFCDFLYIFCSEIFLILRRIQRDVITNIGRFSWIVPVILVRFESTRILLRGSRKFRKNQSGGSRVVQCERADKRKDRQRDRRMDRLRDREAGRKTDGQRDMTKLIVAFRNFANAPTDERKLYILSLLSRMDLCIMRTFLQEIA